MGNCPDNRISGNQVIRTSHVKQPFAQVKLWLISFLLLEPLLPLFLRQRNARAAILHVEDILLQLFDRTRPSAFGKTRSRPAPVSVQTANLLASCLPDFARSAPRWPGLVDSETQPAYADCVRLPKWT